MRKLRPPSRSKREKTFPRSPYHLPNSIFHSSLMNAFYIKFSHFLCCFPTTANISTAPLSHPLQGKTDLKDSPPRFCLKWLPSCRTYTGPSCWAGGIPEAGGGSELDQPTDRLAESGRPVWKDVGEPETNGKNRGSSLILIWGKSERSFCVPGCLNIWQTAGWALGEGLLICLVRCSKIK